MSNRSRSSIRRPSARSRTATSSCSSSGRSRATAEATRAKTTRWRLTDTGRTIARIPIDVKLARMLLESERNGTLREVSVIASFLSIQDPRERPAEVRQLADEAHKHYFDPDSDFTGIVKLWDDYREAHENLTQSKLRDWSQTRFLNFLRMREWRELHRQILVLAQELGWRMPTTGAHTARTRRSRTEPTRWSPLAHPCRRGRYSSGARPLRSHPPRAALRPPRPGRASRLTSATSKARADASTWCFPVPASRRSRHAGCSPPRCSTRSASTASPTRASSRIGSSSRRRTCANTRTTTRAGSGARGACSRTSASSLFGLVLIDRRRVSYDRIDPLGARAVFIREALLPNEIDCRAAFVARNHAVLEDARAEESKRRRHGLVKDDDALYAWLDERIPPDVNNAVALDAWYKNLGKEQRRALEWTLEDVLESEASSAAEFPLALRVAGHDLQIEYRFDPRDSADGATLIVPLAYLNALPAARLGWLVPGFLREKVAELIRALPKALRKNFVPAPTSPTRSCPPQVVPAKAGPSAFACESGRRGTGFPPARE
jgi:ATP-dependent helicase HrpA